ncbi:hypothetical protein C8N47_11042 [Mangrovibacterium marinum]|uniref:Uncharacterized protein n=1 Tax=Mangrovibacterium marinum TaxID=1639118 RepID=A0A2T5C0M9_9BACT|nr:hypothetical protein C8N47_11042 [Mangrovibacterium marinum]
MLLINIQGKKKQKSARQDHFKRLRKKIKQ